jgi:O-antigen biosynthesis protein
MAVGAQPSVTALLPVAHFVPRYLREALDSVRDQTSPRWRLLVIHGSAPDPRLREVLDEYLEDPRIGAVASNGRGLAGALNTGMREATTDYCAILLGDDFWAPHAVEVLERNIAAHPEVDFFHSGKRHVDRQGREIGDRLCGAETFRAEDFLKGAPVKHLLCWRRRLALEIGGMDESFQLVGPDDYDFPWTMAERGARFRLIPETLYLYRQHDDGYRLTTHPPLRARASEVMRMWAKHGATGLRGRARALWTARRYLSKGRGRADRLLRRLLELTGTR